MLKLDQSSNLYTIYFTVNINVAKGNSEIFQKQLRILKIIKFELKQK